MRFGFEGNNINGNTQIGESKFVSTLYDLPRVMPHGMPGKDVAGPTHANVQDKPEPCLGNVDP